MIPKTYALKNADEIALIVSPLINLIIIIFTPLTFLTEKFSKLIILSVNYS